MFLVVRLSPLAKNVPQRNRAGFRFNHLPQVAEVSDAQASIIKSDPFLKVLNFPSVGWFEGMGIERTQKNEDKLRGKDGSVVMPAKLSKTARLALQANGEAFKKTPEPSKSTKTHELTASSPREEIVAALVKKRKVEGKDFDANAKVEALYALLKSL